MFSIERLVQNFTKLCSLLPHNLKSNWIGILNASDLELNHAVTAFLMKLMRLKLLMLDISADRIQALQLGASFKDEQYLLI